LQGSGGAIHTMDSAIVISTLTGLNISGSGATIDLHSPDSGNLQAIALYEQTPCSPQTTGTSESISGGTIYIDGMIDLPCMNFNFTGGSSTTLLASFVAWTISFHGGTSATNIQQP